MDNLDATAIQLKYKDSDMSMIVVLPNQRSGLAALDAKLKATNLGAIVGRMTISDKVAVSLPKFKVEFEVSLPKTLAKVFITVFFIKHKIIKIRLQLGMSTMFSDLADFSGILEESDPIKVSDVVHKAFIDVNEEGSEAAAATGN